MVFERVPAKESSAASRSLLAQSLTFPTAKVTAKNRLLKAAMTERLSTWDERDVTMRGYPTQALINVYDKWSRGGYGIVLSGNVMIDPTNLEAAGNLIISRENDSPKFRALLKQMAEAGVKDGTLFIPQVGHAGRQTPITINSHPWSASTVQLKKYEGRFGQPRELTTEEIQSEVIDRFVFAAKRIYEAGFSGIELHGAHGYLLAQFISPTTNLRTDKYGGPVGNRARIVFEIYDAIRKEIPASTGFIIGIKLNSVEFQEGGLRSDDAKQLALLLEEKGFDFIEVSGGNYEQLGFHHMKESTKKREAYFLEFAEEIKKTLTKLRVFVTGGFRTVEGMASAIRDGATDGVGLARPATAEFDLPKKLLDGRASSTAYTKIAEVDLWMAIAASDSQMWQAGQSSYEEVNGDINRGITDLSDPSEIAKYSVLATEFLKKTAEIEASGKPFYGVLEYELRQHA